MSVFADGRLWLGGRWIPCTLGRSGVVAAPRKREGDGATPAGIWRMRQVLWRADRNPLPTTDLSATPIHRDDGWCDQPGDPNYNRAVRLPYPARAENLWRDDHLYDFVVVLGYNDAPVTHGAGSAIFLHLARADYGPTDGCVGVSERDMGEILALASSAARLMITAERSDGC